MYNTRLNLFDGYSPIENNVSRIFARILHDNQYVFDEFIKFIYYLILIFFCFKIIILKKIKIKIILFFKF